MDAALQAVVIGGLQIGFLFILGYAPAVVWKLLIRYALRAINSLTEGSVCRPQ